MQNESSPALSFAEASPGAPTEFLDMLRMFRACVSERPAETAIAYFDRAITYAELDAYSDSLASWLLDQGVGAGDRVAIVLQNVPQFVIMVVAAWKVGAAPLTMNPMYRVPELARILANAQAKVALCFTGQVDDVVAAGEQAGTPLAVIATATRAFQTRNDPRVFATAAEGQSPAPLLEDVIVQRAGDRPRQIDVDGDSLGLLLYTSGTTGEPKGAMIRHRNLGFNAQILRDWCALDAGSRILAVAPLFHITGFACHLAAAFSARCAMVLHFRVEASLLLDVIREHRPTFTIGAITAFNALSNVPGLQHADMQSFDRIYSGGAPIAPALLEQIEARIGVKIHSSYGMTELTAPSHLAPYMAQIPVDPTSGALSIGKLVPSTAAKIVNDAGEVLPVGETGELMVKGPQVMGGYWRKPEETAKTLEDGWMHTGDVAFVDADGWYYLVDRIKDVIIASGFKVWPREVEDVLYAHRAVREAAVVGAPDAYRGETVKAFVSLQAGADVDPDELIAHCRASLASYKVPRSLEILAELPKTVTGKIQRIALRPTS